jgi:ATP-dependent protease ClpP protease subunit
VSRLWYRIQAKAEPAIAELWIYDLIGVDPWTGEGISAKQFHEELRALSPAPQTIRVHLSSPGGSFFDGLLIANILKQHEAKVEILVEALAASAASIVAMGGDTIKIASNALMMIHNAWSIVIGDIKAMEEEAEALRRVQGSMVATYQWHAKGSAEAIAGLMAAATWFDAEEAVAQGFATEIMEPSQIAAAFDPRALRHLGTVPQTYRARVDALIARPPAPAPCPAPADATAILAACEAAGCMDLARGLIVAQATADQVSARLQRAKEIRALCGMAKQPRLAEYFIAADTPVAAVKAILTDVTAQLDRVEIDASLLPDDGRGAIRSHGINASKIYAERNQLQQGQRP